MSYKILLLSDINSIHTQKWAIALAQHHIQIGIFSLSAPQTNWWKEHSNIQLLFHTPIQSPHSITQKLKYLWYLPHLKKSIQTFNPHILHAHYASSYGLLGALSGFHPFVLSVWGSDVFDFPQKNRMTKKILQHNLQKADIICSTSHVMADETKKYTSKPIEVVPFGVDTDLFKPIYPKKIFTNNELVIGTVKTLSPKYGIDLLIKAFKIIVDTHQHLPLKLLIVGDGAQKTKLMNLAESLHIAHQVLFYGKVENHHVPELLAEMDIFVVLSREESFGVALVEAMACEKPVVASRVSGFKEVLLHKQTGILVEKENIEAATRALSELIQNPALRTSMGKAAREYVLKKYRFADHVLQMIHLYKKLVKTPVGSQ